MLLNSHKFYAAFYVVTNMNSNRLCISGKIFPERTSSGGYLIEPSELFRVFNPITVKPNVTGTMSGSETSYETLLLQQKVAALEAALSDARDERDEWRNQAKRLSLALPSPEHRGKPRKWWKRLTG